MKNFRGFTLTEVLIAMLVLGIIIAATVPVMMRLTPNKNVVMFRKAFYATENIVNSLANDSYYYPDTDDESTSGFANTSSVNVRGQSSPISTTGTTKLRCLFASKLNIKESLSDVCAGTITVVTTMDGMSWNLAGLSGDSGTIHVDVDGLPNGVSCYASCCNHTAGTWTTASATCTALDGYQVKKTDRFQISIKKDGTVQIPGADLPVTPLPNDVQYSLDILNGTKKAIGGED